jgi:hypothetical protein
MLAPPGVVVDSVTLCALVYVPGAGEKVGAATAGCPLGIQYVPMDTDDDVHPAWYAIAWIVMNASKPTKIGAENTVPTVSLGVVPSVVYRMLAPGVVVDSVTFCTKVYVSGTGVNVGADTVPTIGISTTEEKDFPLSLSFQTKLFIST